MDYIINGMKNKKRVIQKQGKTVKNLMNDVQDEKLDDLLMSVSLESVNDINDFVRFLESVKVCFE
jgi:hypothetical protein